MLMKIKRLNDRTSLIIFRSDPFNSKLYSLIFFFDLSFNLLNKIMIMRD